MFRLKRSRKVIGLGLDGFPHSLAVKLMDQGRMPNLKRLAQEGTLKRINSVYPPVSNVAWAAFQTGKGPAEFGVFGFAELQPDFELTIPNATHVRAETIWQRMSRNRKRVVSLSVPMTYPAPAVNGLLVSGFLAPSLDERAVSSPDVLAKLRRTGYEIDIDPTRADSLDVFCRDLLRVSQARQRTSLALLQSEKWDLFFTHVMDTDRINHFMWKYQHQPDSELERFFLDFYAGIDDYIGRVVDLSRGRCGLLVLSDHGFCDLKWEVQLNRWLKGQGYLDYDDDPQAMYKAVRSGSRALALVPGRIYILTEGKWDRGGVSPRDYEPLRDELVGQLRQMRHPDTGDAICKQVFKKEEIFSGAYLDSAPDIVVDPNDGYDLKARLGEGALFERHHMSGMHTYGDALLLASRQVQELARANDIREAGQMLCEYFG